MRVKSFLVYLARVKIIIIERLRFARKCTRIVARVIRVTDEPQLGIKD